jgi:hypothetical protein
MSQGVRVIRPDRAQLRWDMVDLDSQLPDDHRVRVVWAFVQGLDLAEILQPDQGTRRGCRAAGERSRSGIGSLALCERGGDWFGAGDRSLCQQHAAYRWLCGGVPINYDLLAAFRRENAALLDRLLTQSITGLVAEKLISPEELAIDGTKVRLRKPSRGEDQHTFAR